MPSIEEIQSIQAEIRAAKLELERAESKWKKILGCVRSIVISCSHITGRPQGHERVAHIRLEGGVFRVFLEHYVGEGNYEILEKPIRIPQEFLSMSIQEVQAAVQKDRDRRAFEKEIQEKKKEAKEQEKLRKAAYETYLQLKKQFE